jgi:hypothetical protein
MSFLKKISSLLQGGEAPDDALTFYVRCNRCGEKLRIRVDKRHDLTPDYERGGYFLRKEVMDSRCFQLMYAELRFDENHNIVSRDISGGKFITPEEYESEG